MSDIGLIKASSQNGHHRFYKTMFMFSLSATSILFYKNLTKAVFQIVNNPQKGHIWKT